MTKEWPVSQELTSLGMKKCSNGKALLPPPTPRESAGTLAGVFSTIEAMSRKQQRYFHSAPLVTFPLDSNGFSFSFLLRKIQLYTTKRFDALSNSFVCMPYGVLKLRLQMLFFSVHAFIFISWKKIKQRKRKTRVESSKKNCWTRVRDHVRSI